jgi:hypothetical protein
VSEVLSVSHFASAHFTEHRVLKVHHIVTGSEFPSFLRLSNIPSYIYMCIYSLYKLCIYVSLNRNTYKTRLCMDWLVDENYIYIYIYIYIYTY